jgi:hypothetical protein
MVPGAVGMLCKECAALGKSPLFTLSPARWALSVLTALVVGTLIGLVLQYGGFFLFFVGPVIGGFYGQLVLRATGSKRGWKVELLTGGSIVVGAILAAFITHYGNHLLRNPAAGAFFLVAVAITVVAAVAKIRYW